MHIKMAFAAFLIALAILLPTTVLLAENDTINHDFKPDYTANYNENDYKKLVTFFDYEDENGVNNYLKLTDAYDSTRSESTPNTIETEQNGIELSCAIWRNINGELRLIRLELPFMHNLCGKLDLSGCSELEYLCCRDNRITELDVSGCTSLKTLICYHNKLTSLDVSGCRKLNELAFQENSISEIDVSNNLELSSLCCDGNGMSKLDLSRNSNLTELRCESNNLAMLDLSNNPKLSWLSLDGNPLKEFDMSANTSLATKRISAVGGGTISYSINDDSGFVEASTVNGLDFCGWFDNYDQLVSSDTKYTISSESPAELNAKFDILLRGGGGAYEIQPQSKSINNYWISIVAVICIVTIGACGTLVYIHIPRK